jgi:beta-mannosidase
MEISELNYSTTLNQIIDSRQPYVELKRKLEVTNVSDSALWYPYGYGKQNLYDLKVRFATNDIRASRISVDRSQKIGFRKVELVQQSLDTNKDGLSYYFKVNEIPIFVKGTTWISSEVFRAYLNKAKVNSLLKSALDANINTLRMWDGSGYEPDWFYEMTDAAGILVIQNLMFGNNLYPSRSNLDFVDNVLKEVDYQVNRLKMHPSIIMWEGDSRIKLALFNDFYSTNQDKDIYMEDYNGLFSEIEKKLRDIDPLESRPYIQSSPSNGLNQRELDPNNPFYGDTHFYDYKINGWDFSNFNLTRFLSEYGMQSLPSEYALRNFYKAEDMKLMSRLNIHLQRRVDGNGEILFGIKSNLALPSNMNDNDYFRAIIYLSQINQAMTLKTVAELHRRNRERYDSLSGFGYSMGVINKQLYDVWSAPSWSTVENNMNWKMAHYYTRKFYSSILLSPFVDMKGQTLNIFIVSDLMSKMENKTLVIKYYSYDKLQLKYNETINIQAINPIKSELVYSKSIEDVKKSSSCELNPKTATDCILIVELIESNEDKSLLAENFLFMSANISNVQNLKRPALSVSNILKTRDNEYEFDLVTNEVALFVWMELNAGDINETLVFKFSDNGFHMTSSPKKIKLSISGNANMDVNELQRRLKVKSLMNLYHSSAFNNLISKYTYIPLLLISMMSFAITWL